MKKQDTRNCYILFGIVFLLMFASNLTLKVPVTNDEVSTLANAAHLLDLDWRPFLESSGRFYFKYAQALVYLPLFFLFKNPVHLLHAMLTVNSVMTALIAPICYKISRKYLTVSTPDTSFWLSLAAGLTPAPLLYAGYVRADVTIIVMPWLSLWFLLEGWYYKDTSKKKLIINSLLLSVTSVFAFMAHTRGLVLIIAVFLTVLFTTFYLKKKPVHYPVYLLSTVVLLVVDRFLTKFFKNSIWGSIGASGASVENFDFQALLLVFTPDGFASMIKLIIGWFFNMFTSTYGLAALGLVACIILFIYIFNKKKKLPASESIFTLFSLLYFCGSFAMSALFFFRPVHIFYTQNGTSRGDRLIFDRYICATLPFLCFIALYALICKKEYIGKKCKAAACVLQLAILLLFSRFVAFRLDNVKVDRKYFIGMNTFVGLEGGNTIINLENLSGILIFTGAFALAIYLLFLLFTRFKKQCVLFITICAVFTASYTINFVKAKFLVAHQYDSAISKTLEITDSLGDLYKEYPFILKDVKVNGGKAWQFMLPYYDCITDEYSQVESVENMIIVTGTIPFNEKWYNDDYYMFASFDYSGNKKNMPYIKGEALNQAINERGIETIKVTPDMIQSK